MDIKIYKANKTGIIHYLLIGAVILPLVIVLIDVNAFMGKPFALLVLFIPLFFILWIYLDTIYKIENNQLIYQSGFLRGKIEISNIREILKGKTMWSGIKPALAENGLIIKFNKYDEIYIAPKNNDELIADLLQLNPAIKITENK